MRRANLNFSVNVVTFGLELDDFGNLTLSKIFGEERAGLHAGGVFDRWGTNHS